MSEKIRKEKITNNKFAYQGWTCNSVRVSCVSRVYMKMGQVGLVACQGVDMQLGRDELRVKVGHETGLAWGDLHVDDGHVTTTKNTWSPIAS